MIRRILLAVNSSDDSEKAASVASEIARSSAAEVAVFHVREYERVVLRGGTLPRES